MEGSDSDACLPPGWTVKVNVRKNGKIDKFYFPPSRDRKFNSLVGVFRYLNDAKNKAIIQRVPDIESDQQIPRRASKRLAGMKADPLLELKPTRARRDVAKQSGGENKAIISADRSTNSLLGDQPKPLNTIKGSETMLNVKGSEITTENNASKKECDQVLENKDNFERKLDYPDVYDLILTDPCIAFAIQTLTSNTFQTSKDAQAQTSASAEERGKKTNATNDDPKKFAVAEIDKAGPCSEKKHDISKMALSSVNLCKNDYNCSQIFGKESRNVC